MDPAEVFPVSFIGVIRLYRLTCFNFFSPAAEVALLHFITLIKGSNCVALSKNIFPADMVIYFSTLQLPVISPLQRMGNGGDRHA